MRFRTQRVCLFNFQSVLIYQLKSSIAEIYYCDLFYLRIEIRRLMELSHHKSYSCSTIPSSVSSPAMSPMIESRLFVTNKRYFSKIESEIFVQGSHVDASTSSHSSPCLLRLLTSEKASMHPFYWFLSVQSVKSIRSIIVYSQYFSGS